MGESSRIAQEEGYKPSKPVEAPLLSNDEATGQISEIQSNQADFKKVIEKEISQTLDVNGMQEFRTVLREELNQVLESLSLDPIGTESNEIAQGLILALHNSGSDCLVINQSFQGAMYRCFDPLEHSSVYDKAQSHLKIIERGIDKILGYFVLSLVDPRDARQLGSWLGDDGLSDYYFELHVRTLGGVELFIAHEQGRAANIDLDSKSQKLEGKYLIFTRTTPFQWQDDAKLKDTQLEIWNRVHDDRERTEYLDEDELEELQATLKQRSVRRRDQENYCLVVEFENKESDDSYTEKCSAFLKKLKIPMVRYKVPDKNTLSTSGPFFGQEQTLVVAVADFLKKFSELRNS